MSHKKIAPETGKSGSAKMANKTTPIVSNSKAVLQHVFDRNGNPMAVIVRGPHGWAAFAQGFSALVQRGGLHRTRSAALRAAIGDAQ